MHVLIIGGGVVGAGAALHLADEGVDVTLVDRHDQGHATAAGAGIIAPGTSLRPLPPFYPLAADAVRYGTLFVLVACAASLVPAVKAVRCSIADTLRWV